MDETRLSTSIRVTPTAKRLVEEMAHRRGVKQSVIWEEAVREKAERDLVGGVRAELEGIKARLRALEEKSE